MASVGAQNAPAAPTPQATVYAPSVSDLMIATIQPRHIRVWLAVQAKNWDFASYELGNLEGAFRRLGIAHPVQSDLPLQEMIASVTQQPIADLKKAISAKDRGSFEGAYSSLTNACNSCHQAFNHGVVVIKIPGAPLMEDQGDLDLAPAKP
jgi:hypothetical protein